MLLVNFDVKDLNLRGRINRLDFFIWSGVSTAAFCVILAEYTMLRSEFLSIVLLIWFSLCFLLWLAAMLMLCVKRLHDMDLSGWHVLWIWSIGSAAVMVQPYDSHMSFILASMNSFAALLLFLGPGTLGPNRFNLIDPNINISAHTEIKHE